MIFFLIHDFPLINDCFIFEFIAISNKPKFSVYTKLILYYFFCVYYLLYYIICSIAFFVFLNYWINRPQSAARKRPTTNNNKTIPSKITISNVSTPSKNTVNTANTFDNTNNTLTTTSTNSRADLSKSASKKSVAHREQLLKRRKGKYFKANAVPQNVVCNYR